MENIIDVNNLTLHYNEQLIFKDISFNIKAKEFITIMGANGSGKSLLVHLLMGLLPYEGSIKLMNHELNKLNSDSIMENISIIMEDVDDAYMEKNVVSEFMDVNVDSKLLRMVIKDLGLQNLLERDPRTLSVGEKQLINIACAILEQKPIIVLDNALSMLDKINKDRVFKLLKKFNEKGTMIINITHDSEELLFSKRIIVLDRDTVVIDDNIKAAFANEKEFINARISMPFIVELCTKLKYYNIITKIELDNMKLVNSIWN